MYEKPRGAPENVGRELKAVHPVVRTNPVSGWKSIFPVGGHVGKINGVTEEESKALLKWFSRLLVDNHDLQVRFKWQTVDDIAIWDNRLVRVCLFMQGGISDILGYLQISTSPL